MRYDVSSHELVLFSESNTYSATSVAKKNGLHAYISIFALKMIVFLKHFSLYVSVDDIQLSCYRILTSLYSLGTGKNIYVEKYKNLYCLGNFFFSEGTIHFFLKLRPLCWVFTDSFPRWVNVYLLWLEPCLLLSWNPN